MMAALSVKRHLFRHAQRGAASVAIAFLVMFLLAGALATAFSVSGALIQDSVMNLQQTQALFLAESGMARALRRYSIGGTGNSCTELRDAASINFGKGNFQVISAATTLNDFSGQSLVPAVSHCLVRAVGIVPGGVPNSGVTRTIEAIMLRSASGFPPSANVDFNAPPGTCNYPSCQPTNWNGSIQWWDDTGGKGPPTNRGALAQKDSSGPGKYYVVAGYDFYPSVTRTGGSTLTLKFDFKTAVMNNDNKMSLTFTLSGTQDGHSISIFFPVVHKYSDTWTTGTTQTVTLPSGGTIYINHIDFNLGVDPGNSQYKAWLDNIQLSEQDTNPASTTEAMAIIKLWREVVQ